MMKLFGWTKKVGQWVDRAQEAMTGKEARAQLDLVGEAIRDEVRRSILEGKVGGPALAKSTIGKKGHALPLVDSGRYVRSITATPAVRGVKRSRILVRVNPDPDFQKIAFLHEFGSSRFPARPHWRPAFVRIRKSPAVSDLIEGKWFKLDVKGF